MLRYCEMMMETKFNSPLSLKIVHNSPPRQVSISIYKYFLSLNVLYNLTMNSQFISDIISFSDMICCCCLVSTIWAFFICLSAKDLVGSPWICTSSTLPKPPIPNVAMMRRSERRKLANSSFSLELTKFMLLKMYRKQLPNITRYFKSGQLAFSLF